jgi:hypothetical protein
MAMLIDNKIAIFSFLFLLCACQRLKNPLEIHNRTTDESNIAGLQRDINWPSLAQTDWPMHQHDPQFTGRGKGPGPQLGKIKWRYAVPGPVGNSPVLGLDSTVIFSSSDELLPPSDQASFLYSLLYSGSFKWKYRTKVTGAAGAEVGCAPLVAQDGTIYIGSSDRQLYAIGRDGKGKWIFTADQSIDLAGMSIGLDGTVYFLDRNHAFYAVQNNGVLRWKTNGAPIFQEGSTSSIAMAPDGSTLYLGVTGSDSARGLAAVGLDGKMKWLYKTGYVSCTPLVDNQGNVYFQAGLGLGSEEGRTGIYSITSDGRLRWKIPAAYANPNGMTMDYNGNLYAAWEKTGTVTFLLSINGSGKISWQYDLSALGSVTSSLVCDVNGDIYGASKNMLFAVTNHGLLKWQIELGPMSNVGPALANGALYIGTWWNQGSPSGKEFFCIE